MGNFTRNTWGVLLLLGATATTHAAEDRYYDPVVTSFAASEAVERTDYYLLFEDNLAARRGADLPRLQQQENVEVLYYTGSLPTCRAQLEDHLQASETSDRERDRKATETECVDAGKRFDMGFAWHCYVAEDLSQERGCEMVRCFTHYVCR